MQPEQSLQAHRDLGGKWLVPIHNGTFDLALHAWREPLERISALAEAQQVNISTPRFGEPVDIMQPQSRAAWWRAEPATQQTAQASTPAADTESATPQHSAGPRWLTQLAGLVSGRRWLCTEK